MPVMTKPFKWETPTENFKLACNEVHLWRVCLNLTASYQQRLKSILSVDEKYRAHKYRFLVDRNHFIVARGVLRIILGCYLNMKPNKRRFSYESFEKPVLDDQTKESPDLMQQYTVETPQLNFHQKIVYLALRNLHFG